jgi:hypothetical protein
MSDRTGELCPFCKVGKLYPTGTRLISEPFPKSESGETQREFTEYECDNCHRKTEAHGISLIETAPSPSLKGEVKDKEEKTTSKFYVRSKVSKRGKEAKENLTIDIAGNRKRHHVEEQDKNGRWSIVHDEDEPLKKKKTKTEERKESS